MLSFIIPFENSWIFDLFWFWDSILCSIIDFYTLFMTYKIWNENIYITLLTKKWWLLLKRKTKRMLQISFLSWRKYLVAIYSLKTYELCIIMKLGLTAFLFYIYLFKKTYFSLNMMFSMQLQIFLVTCT